MNISEGTLHLLEKHGMEKPTEIQRMALPLIEQGFDVVGQSETGSGKTLAFAIPIIEAVETGKGIQALVLTPTRELANQIENEVKRFSRHKNLKIVNIHGGVPINPQIKDLQKADVVVGTPGRILDHVRRRTIDFSKVKYLVIDEADRMLDMGFIDDVKTIIGCTPKTRQTLLFSATIPPEVRGLASRYMKNPKTIRTKELVDPKLLNQYYYDVKDKEKFSMLVHLLRKENPKKALVFTNMRKTSDIVARNLSKQGFKASVLHGGLTQTKRDRMMERFRKGEVRILVATDVASRGLDINGVTHVFNYDVPNKAEDYIHRVGRTARAGKNGKAITILGRRDHEAFRRVMTKYELSIERMEEKFQKIPFKYEEEKARDRYSRDIHHGRYNRGDRGRF